MEINVVTLHVVVETTPPQMRSLIKAKGGLLQKASVRLFFFFFGRAVYAHQCKACSRLYKWFLRKDPLSTKQADCVRINLYDSVSILFVMELILNSWWKK